MQSRGARGVRVAVVHVGARGHVGQPEQRQVAVVAGRPGGRPRRARQPAAERRRRREVQRRARHGHHRAQRVAVAVDRRVARAAGARDVWTKTPTP